MKIVLTIVAFLVYSFLMWWVGVWMRRNLLMRKGLNRIKSELKPGYQVTKEWHGHYRKAGMAFAGLVTLALLVPTGVALWSYLAEFRTEFLLMAALVAASPTLLGWWGVIPIPGLEIDT